MLTESSPNASDPQKSMQPDPPLEFNPLLPEFR